MKLVLFLSASKQMKGVSDEEWLKAIKIEHMLAFIRADHWPTNNRDENKSTYDTTITTNINSTSNNINSHTIVSPREGVDKRSTLSFR